MLFHKCPQNLTNIVQNSRGGVWCCDVCGSFYGGFEHKKKKSKPRSK